MLQMIKINSEDVCRTEFSMRSGETEIICENYWLNWDAYLEVALSQKMNLDRFLTLHLSAFLSHRGLKSDVLIFYAPAAGRFALSVCCKRRIGLRKMFEDFSTMPKAISYGQDFLSPNAIPFFFYWQMRLYRVHCIKDQGIGSHYVADFGNPLGLNTEKCDADVYNRIKWEPKKYVDYSAVPEKPIEEIKLDGMKFTLQHVLCNWETPFGT
jgi:hypothetical protein